MVTLCDPMDYRPPGSSVGGVLQARILKGLPFPPPGDLPDSGIKAVSLMWPSLTDGFFTTSAAETLLGIFNNIAGHQLKSNIY